jgi:hypothetical protein
MWGWGYATMSPLVGADPDDHVADVPGRPK